MRRWTGSTARIAPVATLANVKAETMPPGLEEDIPRRRLRPVRWSRASYPLGVAGLAAVYYGSARLGYALGFSGPVAAIVWLPVGVAIAAVYLGGIRYWPGVL